MSIEGAPENPGEIVANLLVTNLEGRTVEELEGIKAQVQSAFYEDMPATDASALSSMEEEIDLLIAEQKKQEVTESKEELPENLREIKTELDSRKEKRRSQRAQGEEIKRGILQRIGSSNPEFMSRGELEEYRLWLKTQLKWKGLDREAELHTKIQEEIVLVDGYVKEKDRQAPASETLNLDSQSTGPEVRIQDEPEVDGGLEDGPELNTGEIPAEIIDDVLPADATSEERSKVKEALKKGWGTIQQVGKGAGNSVKEIVTTKEGFYRFTSGAAASAAIKVGFRVAGLSGLGLSVGAGAAGGMIKSELGARRKRSTYSKAEGLLDEENPSEILALIKKKKLSKLDAAKLISDRRAMRSSVDIEDEHEKALLMNEQFDAGEKDGIALTIFNNLEELESLSGVEKLNEYIALTEQAQTPEMFERYKVLEREMSFVSGRKISKQELAKAALVGAIGGAVGNVIGGYVVEHFNLAGLHMPSWLGGGHSTEHAVTHAPAAGRPSLGGQNAPGLGKHAPIKGVLTDTGHVPHDSAPASRGATVDSMKVHTDTTPKAPTGVPKAAASEGVVKAPQLEAAPAPSATPEPSEVHIKKEIDLNRFKIGVTAHEVEVNQPELHELTMAEATAPDVMKGIDAEHMQVGELLNKLADANVPSGPELDAAYTLHDLHPTAEDLHKTVAEYLHDRLAPDSIISSQLHEMQGVELQGTETVNITHHVSHVGAGAHAAPQATSDVHSEVIPTRGPQNIDPSRFKIGVTPTEGAGELKPKMPTLHALTPEESGVKSLRMEAPPVTADTMKTIEPVAVPKTKAEEGFFHWLFETPAGIATTGVVGGLAGAGAVGYGLNRAHKKQSRAAEVAAASESESESGESTESEGAEAAEDIEKENAPEVGPEAANAEETFEKSQGTKREAIMKLLPPKGGFIFGRNNEVREVESLLNTKKPRDLFNALYAVAEKHPDKIEDIRKAGAIALSLYPGALNESDRLRAQLDALEESIKEDTGSTS